MSYGLRNREQCCAPAAGFNMNRRADGLGASCVAGEAVVRWARCLVLNCAVNQRTLPG